MKKIIIMLILISVSAFGFAQEKYERNGDNFTTIKKSKESVTNEPTKFKVDGKVVYISSNGSCFVWENEGTPNQKKVYLGREFSMARCAELGREYKGNNRKNEKK